MEDFWKVYILYKNDKPVYVGCTNQIEKRLKNHKKDKDFDAYSVFYANGFKEKSLAVEKVLINFLIDHFPLNYNKQKRSFNPYGEFKINF